MRIHWREWRSGITSSEKRLLPVLSGLMAALGLATALGANAQQYPNKAIHMVIGVAAGGAADVVARLIAQKAGERLGQTILVENRTGAGGTIGAALVAKSPADGYTVLFVTASHATNPTLHSKLPYDTLKDFAPVSGAIYQPLVVVVNAQSKYKGLNDLIADARARPGKLNYASAAGSGLVALSAEVFREQFKLNFVPINYKGSAPALAALMANEVDFVFDTVGGVVGHVTAGRMRAIAVTTRHRAARRTDHRRSRRTGVRCPGLVRNPGPRRHTEADRRPAEQGDPVGAGPTEGAVQGTWCRTARGITGSLRQPRQERGRPLGSGHQAPRSCG